MNKHLPSKWARNCATEIDANWTNRYAAIIDRHHKNLMAKQRRKKRAAVHETQSRKYYGSYYSFNP